MDNLIAQTKSEFLRAKDGLVKAFETTPEDRINWSPSPTARTPVQIIAHSASAIKLIHDTLDGNPPDINSPDEGEVVFREWEQQFHTREEVLRLLEANSVAFVDWLDALDPARLDATVTMPFGLGSMPIGALMTHAAAHTQGHIAQLEYIQTIYGDRNWHMS